MKTARRVWSDDQLLQDADSLDTLAGGSAHGLNVEVPGIAGCVDGKIPAFPTDGALSLPETVAPFRMPVSEPDHLELVERFEVDGPRRQSATRQLDREAPGPPRAGSPFDRVGDVGGAAATAASSFWIRWPCSAAIFSSAAILLSFSASAVFSLSTVAFSSAVCALLVAT